MFWLCWLQQVISLAAVSDAGDSEGVDAGDGASLGVGSEDNLKFRSAHNVKRNLVDAFDKAADVVGDMPPKIIKTEK
jgi:hypothetical protein